MADTFLLEVATPESPMLREQVSEAQIPAKNGYIGVLPGHAPLLSELGEGKLTYVCEGHKRSLNVQGGWMEVTFDSVRVLATSATREPA